MRKLILLLILVAGCKDSPPTQPKKPAPKAEDVGKQIGGSTKGVVNGVKDGWNNRNNDWP